MILLRIARKELIKIQLENENIHFIMLDTYVGDPELSDKAQTELEKEGIDVGKNPIRNISFGRGIVPEC